MRFCVLVLEALVNQNGACRQKFLLGQMIFFSHISQVTQKAKIIDDKLNEIKFSL
jgi:hypothetical protein